jgi:hypothetical protein
MIIHVNNPLAWCLAQEREFAAYRDAGNPIGPNEWLWIRDVLAEEALILFEEGYCGNKDNVQLEDRPVEHAAGVVRPPE